MGKNGKILNPREIRFSIFPGSWIVDKNFVRYAEIKILPLLEKTTMIPAVIEIAM